MKSPFRQDFIARVRPHLGERGVTTDEGDIAPWLTDWRQLYRGLAFALVSPASTEEVSVVLSAANELGVPVVPQGGNTSMVGGATPDASGSAVILSLRRMNRIRVIDREANLAEAEAGVILSTLHEAALSQGRRFPLSLGAKGSATVGGLVSTNAGGTQVLRFGTMRRLVAGLEAVLPDGTVYDGMAALKKDNRGYDLTQLLIGAEGTLGVVTAASLRLVRAAADSAVAWIGLRSPAAALRLLRWLEAATGEAIESFEIIPGPTLDLVLAHIPGTRAPLDTRHPWHVLVEHVSDGGSRDTIEALLARAIDSGLADNAAVSASLAQAQAFWKLRESISEAERASGPAMQHDISVPVDDMPAFMVSAAAAVEARFPGVHASAYGHLGDGNVHFHVRAPAGADGERWRRGEGREASRMVYDLVVASRGSISAEHGIGQMKRDELLRLSSPARITALRAIKHALDPRSIMNPGKLVPLAPDEGSA
jgi:FAD/FMN-containing dehydrogenase